MIAILTAVCFSWFMINIVQYHRRFNLYFNRKPFNCVPCLSAWSAVFFYFVPCEVLTVLFVAGTAGALLQKHTL